MTVDANFAGTVGTVGTVLFTYYLYTTWTRRMTMRGRVSTFGNGFGGRIPRPKNDAAESSTAKSPPSEHEPNHEPSIADVLVVKAMLGKALGLPPEIVDTITDLAEYWPHTTSELTFDGPSAVAHGSSSSSRENVFLLRSPPLGLHNWDRVSFGDSTSPIDRTPLKPQPPRDEFSADDFQELIDSPIAMLAHPCRRIVFTIKSSDQGWGGAFGDRHTYNGSWTWFEAGLERWCKTSPAQTDAAGQQKQPDQKPSLQLEDLCTVFPEVELGAEEEGYVFKHPLHANDHLKVQSNMTAQRESKVHRIVWAYTDDIEPARDTEPAERLASEGRGKATGDGKFVRDLKLGDVVTLWAKARFAGWVNNVESARMDVYYAI